MPGEHSGQRFQCSRALLVLLASFLAVTLTGCKSGESRPRDIDAAISKDLPSGARLVAHSRTAGKPLLFQAPSRGQVYYVANGDIVATLLVNEGEQVRLNSFSPNRQPRGKPWTELTIDDDVAYKAEHTRAGDNRLYFLGL